MWHQANFAAVTPGAPPASMGLNLVSAQLSSIVGTAYCRRIAVSKIPIPLHPFRPRTLHLKPANRVTNGALPAWTALTVRAVRALQRGRAERSVRVMMMPPDTATVNGAERARWRWRWKPPQVKRDRRAFDNSIGGGNRKWSCGGGDRVPAAAMTYTRWRNTACHTMSCRTPFCGSTTAESRRRCDS